MNPQVLQTAQLMLSILASDKENLVGFKVDAAKILDDLLAGIAEDAKEFRKQTSPIIS